MINVNIRMDKQLKADAEAVLTDLGLSVSEAVRLFFVQVRNTGSIPFTLKVADKPNERLKKILREAETEYKSGKLEHYDSVDAFITAMEAED